VAATQVSKQALANSYAGTFRDVNKNSLAFIKTSEGEAFRIFLPPLLLEWVKRFSMQHADPQSPQVMPLR